MSGLKGLFNSRYYHYQGLGWWLSG